MYPFLKHIKKEVHSLYFPNHIQIHVLVRLSFTEELFCFLSNLSLSKGKKLDSFRNQLHNSVSKNYRSNVIIFFLGFHNGQYY